MIEGPGGGRVVLGEGFDEEYAREVQDHLQRLVPAQAAPEGSGHSARRGTTVSVVKIKDVMREARGTGLRD